MSPSNNNLTTGGHCDLTGGLLGGTIPQIVEDKVTTKKKEKPWLIARNLLINMICL